MDSVEVSSADIARLAGVRPTAVSNWRRRHADFPSPIGGTEKSPRFSLDDVLRWLARQGRNVEIGTRREFTQAVNAAAHTTPTAETLRNALLALLDHAGDTKTDETGWRDRLTADGQRLRADHPGLAPVDIGQIDHAQATMLNAAIEAAADRSVRELAAELYDETVDRRLGQGDTATPAELARLMVALAEPGDGPLVDLACGAGTILKAAAELGCRDVRGTEIDPARAQLAALRLRAAGLEPQVRVSIANAAALGDDPFGAASAAAVATYPPFNDRNWSLGVRRDEPWWTYGMPTGRESELAWVQRALYQLRPGGTAVLVMPPAAATRPSGRRIRRLLIGDGALAAVIALPRGSLHGTGLAPHLWILRPTPESAIGGAVLTADLGGHTTDDQRPDWDRIEADATAAWTAHRRGDAPPGPDAVATPVTALLEGAVDLTPGRYLPLRFGSADLRESKRRGKTAAARIRGLAERIDELPEALPGLEHAVRWETIETLEEDRAISLHRGLPVLEEPKPGSGAVRAVRARPGDEAEYADCEPDRPVPRVRDGDLIAEVIGDRIWVRPAAKDDLGAAPAWGSVLVRTDPERVDPAFLAGFLAGNLAEQQLTRASTSLGVNSIRDLRRLRIALPDIEDQRRYAGLFTALARIAADAAALADQADGLARSWRDSAWAAIVDGTDPATT